MKARRVMVALNFAIIISASCIAQVEIGGQVAAQFYRSASLQTPRAINQGRPGIGWQTVLTGVVGVTENVSASGIVNITDRNQITIEYLAIRMSDLTPLGLNFQIGRFDLPFGNLGERRYPRRNPLFGLPLIHEYRTALPDNVVSQSALLAGRGLGTGMRVLDMGIYDLGMMVSGSAGILDYAFALSTGTVSAATYGLGNSNGDMNKIFRLAVTPMAGLTLGAAYAWGAYLDELNSMPTQAIDFNTYIQKSLEFDFDYSRGHLVLNGEGVYTEYPVPLETGDEIFKVFGYNVEARYTLVPRFSIALRIGGLRFGNALLGSMVQPWDYDVDELEGGLGYFLDRDVLCKLVRRETRTSGGTRPKDSLTALQFVVAF
jgi:hypothetical protein